MSSYENEVPSDNSYVSRQGHKNEPLGVVSDETKIEDPVDSRTADSDQQLGMFTPPPLHNSTRTDHTCCRA